MASSKLPGELTWPKLLGTTLAAVVAAWFAGHFGIGGTMGGVAIGSLVVTFFSAFFTSTIDKTHQTILVRTDRGTVIETRGDSEVAEEGGQTTVLPAQDPMSTSTTQPVPALGAEETPSRWSQIQWKSVGIATLITMAITMGAISIYEGAVGRTWGSNEPGTTIGNTVHGGPPAYVTPTPTPSEEPSDSPTPSEEPSESPTPSEEPTPSPSPSETTDPDACPTSTAPPATPTPTPSPTPTDCPSVEPTDDATDGGLFGRNQ